MNNLDLWQKVRAVPSEAQKEIKGGRLKGKTDINPMWRIKELTEQFGLCGVGWKYVITKQWVENGGNNEIAAFVNIDLFIKVDGAWSDPIPGTGGNMLVAKESSGLYTSDECFKMALTDAISVSCKALGFGADVYWEKDSTKYNKQPQEPTQPQRNPHSPTQPPKEPPVNWVKFWKMIGDLGFKKEDVLHIAKTADISKYTNEDCKKLYAQLQMKKAQLEASAGKELTPEELSEQIRLAETLKDVP